MRKLLLYVTLLGLLLVSISIYNYRNDVRLSTSAAMPQEAPWHPASLQIPSLDIDAPVMNVGATETGLMDAPTSKAVNSPYWSSVFWYAPGAAPGQAGNAVIAGHVDQQGGDPAIFWALHTLKTGDEVMVKTREQKTLTFEVERVVKYPADAPSKEVLNEVFGPTTVHQLNLITCSGIWTNNGYDERLVVFSRLVHL